MTNRPMTLKKRPLGRVGLAVAGLAILLQATPIAQADPCGMVPPITINIPNSIARIGDQITYVFYKDGIETFVIRPGFTGKVEEFGMLIPFPNPPAIRKSADEAFGHIAAAIDPPEVVIDLRRYLMLRSARAGGGGRRGRGRRDGLEVLAENEVRVLREEAVGMYEVAVLDAGSAAALQAWMDDHGYKYPEGMDKACGDYVSEGWCFVAVKTRVGAKGAVDPKPGMREVNPGLPAGSSFDGHVQGMAFRFHSEELVVPMRLASFNAGELRNIVYLLTDGPRKIRAIPEEYVVRQLSGDDVVKNLTQPLPLRVIGGTEADIPQGQRQSLPQMRDPLPRSGLAKTLFAGDLLAASQNRLSHPYEESEKMLLRIGESLMLRGAEIDKVNRESLTEEREATLGKSLDDLNDMTLTVIDGDFPREVLASSNLTFAEYSMPAQRNKTENYDAKERGPTGEQDGVLYLGALPAHSENFASSDRSNSTYAALSALALALVGLLVLRGRSRAMLGRAMLIAAILCVGMAGTSMAQDNQADEQRILDLIKQFSSADQVDAATSEIIEIGQPAVAHLAGEALEGEDIVRRGWSIDCIAKIGGEDADKYLQQILSDSSHPELVRTWAAAGRVAMADSVEELVNLAEYVSAYPAVGRPIGLRMVAALNNPDSPPAVEDVLAITLQVPQLDSALAPTIMGFGVDSLTNVMTTAKNQQVRNKAAGYLGAIGQQEYESVAEAVVEVYKLDREAKAVPWNGGPLWIPGITWQKDEGTRLVGNLVRWHVWCDLNGKSEEKQQIHNNIRSVQLAAVVGYENPGWQDVDTDRWLTVWGNLVGQDELRKLLEEQDAAENPKYMTILANAPKK